MLRLSNLIQGVKPDTGTTFTVTYEYFPSVVTLQTLIDLDENRIVNADVLIKEANRIDVDVSVTIKLFSGYDLTNVTSQIASSLTNFFTSLRLGVGAEQADVVSLIKSVAGVDNIRLPLTKFERIDQPTPPLTNPTDIATAKNEYLNLRNLVITTF